MPIKTPGGILEVEDAKLRASYLLANTSVGIGTSTTVPDGASLYIDEDNPTIRFQEGTTTSAARILAKSGTLRLESGTDYDQPELTGDIAFSNIQGGTTHMIIKGDGNVGIGTDSPSQMLDVSGNVQVGTANLFVDTTTGRVGVGVTEMTSTFEVAGNTATQEYPPQAMTGYETYMEGHGVFRASASSTFNAYYVYRIFNKANPLGGNTGASAGWASQGPSTETDTYNATTGLEALSTTHHTSSAQGEWVQFETPHPIKLKTLDIHSRAENGYVDDMTGFPKDVYLYGSNDNAHWSLIKNFTTVSKTAGASHLETIDATEAYKQYAFVVNSIHVSGTDVGWTSIGQLYFNGTPAPSSLEDGHLTLGKTLTTPRVSGHPAGAETPRAESLLVHYDTTVDSVASGTTVVDTSGNGVDGVLTDGAAYSSSQRAFTFDGASDQFIYVSNAGNGSGNWTHSISFWLKPEYDGTGNDVAFRLGPGTNNKSFGFLYNATQIAYYFYGNDYSVNKTLSNQWYHITLTYDGSTRSIYIDGTLFASSSSGGGLLNLDGNNYMHIGSNQDNSAPMTGSISNFKIWGGVALTAEEVAAEYALGRTGKSINITDTAVCIGGTVPRAQLDVRGDIIVENAAILHLFHTPLINEWQFTGSDGLTKRLTYAVPDGTKAVLADVFISQHSNYDHINHVLGRSHTAGQQNWTNGQQQPSAVFGDMSRHVVNLTMPGESDGFSHHFGKWFSSQIIPIDVDKSIYQTNRGATASTTCYFYIVTRGYYR